MAVVRTKHTNMCQLTLTVTLILPSPLDNIPTIDDVGGTLQVYFIINLAKDAQVATESPALPVSPGVSSGAPISITGGTCRSWPVALVGWRHAQRCLGPQSPAKQSGGPIMARVFQAM